MQCQKCKSTDVKVEMVTETTLKKKRKGIFYWLFGWIFDLLLWFFLTLPRLIYAIFKPKSYKLKLITKKVAVCQNCGHSWDVK